MNKKTLFTLWGCLFILCAGLGFIPEPEGAVKNLLFCISLVFFLPPAWILQADFRSRNRDGLRLMRNLSGLSLLVTLVLILLNILSVRWPLAAGNLLHVILTVVSSPMLCCGNWFVSLFLWACLLMVSLKGLKACS